MIIQRAYHTRLNPTKDQEAAFILQSDVTRYCYNRFLARRIEHYSEHSSTIKMSDIVKEFRSDRPDWTRGASSRAEETAARSLDLAYKNFFEKRAKFPKFKSRHRGTTSFSYWGMDPKHVTDTHIRLQGIGWVRFIEHGYVPTSDVKINSATVSERAGRWWISVQVEMEVDDHHPTGDPVGVDVGISTLATTSDGRKFDNPRSTRKHERKLARLQRGLARQEKGSNRREVTKRKISRLHEHISNTRAWHTHQASASIVGRYSPDSERPSVVVVEDLNVDGMKRNRHLAKSVSDANMSELRRQIDYKAAWQGTEIVTADRFYPSSKTCSECGAVMPKLSLSERTFVCTECGCVMDRDENAARNLKNIAS